MNSAEQASFAWALADIVKPFIHEDALPWLHAEIGAGDLEAAITSVLNALLRAKRRLPREFNSRLREWIAGYSGCEVEGRLHWVADQVASWAIDGRQLQEDLLASMFRHEHPDADIWDVGGARAVDLTSVRNVQSTSATA
jgi:hypothetical protein